MIRQIVFSSHKWQSTTYWFKHADSKMTDSGYWTVSSCWRMILFHCSLLLSVSRISLMQLNLRNSWLQTIWLNACHSYHRVTCWVSAAEHVAVATNRVTTLFQQWFSMTFPWPKNEFPWPIGTAYFFEIINTRFMNAYQNKNIFPVACQSVSK